jgi:hypothetical protein
MRLRGAIAAALALICLLTLAPLAQADYDPLGSGATKLTLDKGFLALLRQNGVKLSATAPAKLKGTTATFPVSGGKFDPTNAKGTVEHEGALVFEKGNRSLPLSALQLKTTQRHSPFSVKAGGGQLKLAAAKSLAVTREGFGEKVKVRKLSLSAKVATRLAKKLRLKGVFEEGQPLGQALTRARPQTVTVLGQGKAELSLDPTILAKLQSLFVAVNPIFPAEHVGSLFTLPIFGGTIAPDASLGTLETQGSLEFLQLGGGQVFWAEDWLDLDAKTASPEVNVQPSPPYQGKVGRVPIAGLGLTGASISSDPKARTVTVTGASLALQASTAATFNEVFARPQGKEGVFAVGEALGAVSFVAQGQ